MSIRDPDWRIISSPAPIGEGRTATAPYFSIADQIAAIVHGADDALPGDVDGSWETLRTLLSEGT
jgi:hypothetical protein